MEVLNLNPMINHCINSEWRSGVIGVAGGVLVFSAVFMRKIYLPSVSSTYIKIVTDLVKHIYFFITDSNFKGK